jgi:hypothetical protein
VTIPALLSTRAPTRSSTTPFDQIITRFVRSLVRRK